MRKSLTTEQAAFLDDLAVRCSDMLMNYAMRFLRYQAHLYPLAQECVQETFVRAIACVDTLMQHENPVGWLKVSLKYHLLNSLRREKQRRLKTYEATVPEVSEALLLWEETQTLTDVLTIVQGLLTVEEQRTFEAYFRQGMTAEETALLESVPESTIRGRISRIRRKLKKHFPELCGLLLLIRCMG